MSSSASPLATPGTRSVSGGPCERPGIRCPSVARSARASRLAPRRNPVDSLWKRVLRAGPGAALPRTRSRWTDCQRAPPLRRPPRHRHAVSHHRTCAEDRPSHGVDASVESRRRVCPPERATGRAAAVTGRGASSRSVQPTGAGCGGAGCGGAGWGGAGSSSERPLLGLPKMRERSPKSGTSSVGSDFRARRNARRIIPMT